MKIARVSVERPVLTMMLTLIVLVLGGVSLSRLQIDLLPEIELPTVTIRTEYDGASPEVMEQRVTTIIEEIVATVPGVEDLESTSSEGDSSVKVTFGWGIDVDMAAIDVNAKLEDEINELPDDIVRPRVSKFDVGSFPVVILGISSQLDPIELTTLVDEQLRHRFSQIPGVAQVDPWGEYAREVRVELDPARLRALGIPLDQIRQALIDANLDLPAGKIERGQEAVTVRAPAQFRNLEQIRSTVVAVRGGAAVELRQIAEVRDTYEKLERLARVNGAQGLRLAIRKQSDANTVEVSARVLAEVEAINRDYPQIEVVPVINQGNFIERSIANVARSVLYGGALAIVVLLFFLRNLRSTAVIALAIPISLIATFALIYFTGLTINLMTLGGLALGVGMMVDNSIVVLENIFRRRDELGEDIAAAAVAGTAEVGPAIVASTVTTLVIFLPLAFVGGVSGVLFEDLALVVAFALACSLLISLSVVPMLAAKLLRPRAEGRRPGWVGELAAGADRAFASLDERYGRLLDGALRHRAATIITAAVALAASLLLLPTIGTEFMPPSDEGEVRVTGEMPVGSKLALVDRQTRLLESHVYPQVPETMSSVVSVAEAASRNPSESFRGELRLTLTPAAERERSNVEIAAELREQLRAKVPGMEIRTRAPQGQFLLERVLGGDEGLVVEVRGFELETLDRLGRRAAEVIAEVPGITDVDLSREAGIPQATIEVDRAKAASLGLSPRDIAVALETAVAGAQAGEYRVGGYSYRILIQLAEAEHLPLSEILDLTLRTPAGEEVALRNVVTSSPGLGPIVIERKDQQRLVRITANVAGRDLGSVAADVETQLAEIPRPVGYDFVVAGSFEEQQEAFNELLVSLLLALLLVYMVLAAQYESLRDPLIVMLSVPVAAIGVLAVLSVTNTTLNVQSYIGCIMLGGIVVNNAILLVDQARRLQDEEGLAGVQAAALAGRRRLRPILMTTLTTVLALLPLGLGIGEGADAQAPMARAVLGGLVASTLLTLVLIPAVFTLVHRERED
ncbi:efflux RND transporter permease subunit [Enhygromyxa salina]|uniref:Cobalt-zinc-cadmium resistance protein CzcA n=1 Tax=Enhygromyxa salina TaxID=215803 RepID=A0A2S9YSY3_9BACT|nr:efflux RND transporter permease subunit [Enhygromyxa salina]PRQ08196.1 Cobalt-zinc-cadmium resistance protein CzcA [Enhygromyxa salina]